ncbi:MAG: hypothetical protein Q7K39_04925 [Candidatus Magasanikbacteria bacterium]|nr:hypothetical protein [Candidatus Magasanikbacteria bacterium]
MSKVLGIDLGTANSCMAIIEGVVAINYTLDNVMATCYISSN